MSKNAIWITGAEGRLGSALLELLKKDTNNKVVGTDMDVDITDMDAVEQSMKVYRPNIVINCASISDADYCEQNIVKAFKVNDNLAEQILKDYPEIGMSNKLA